MSVCRRRSTHCVRLWFVSIALVSVLVTGCQNPQNESAAREQSNLKPLAILYGQYLGQHRGQPPKDAEQFKKFIGETKCFFCGTSIGKSDTICSNCSKEVMKCSVCKLSISYGDQIASCPKCNSKAHLSHLHEWIKTQGKCPTCLQEIKLRNLILNEENKKEEEN